MSLAQSYQIGVHAFNGAPEMASFLAYLKEDYHIQTAIETGTYLGGTTDCLGHLFEIVNTLEVVGTSFDASVERFTNRPNIHCHFGSSGNRLAEISAPYSHEPVLFYLDAHWHDDWPLLDELDQIYTTHRNNCVIVIDDCKVPSRPDIGYDSYAGNALSLEYVQQHLDKIFDNYAVFYLIPVNLNAKAKLVAMPI